MKKILITGAGGLIGSEAVESFSHDHYEIYGIENNQRKKFFGESGSTNLRLSELKKKYRNFRNYDIDIRDKDAVLNLFKEKKFDVVIHTAAQPSHDKSFEIPFEDFEINANGTLNLLESVRQYNKDCIFIHMSTNKVYGDAPNKLKLIESDKRYDFADKIYENGIDENFTIDKSLHSLFGVSKLSSDLLVQEYGKYFSIPSCSLRGGCLTGQNHSGVELHGFLNYLVKCNLENKKYTIFGYNGKQVRDNIHSTDVIQFMKLFIENPLIGEVYNLGGGKSNSCSILESFDIVSQITKKNMIYDYSETNRKGDHICYYSNLDKIKSQYSEFDITLNLYDIVEKIYHKLKQE